MLDVSEVYGIASVSCVWFWESIVVATWKTESTFVFFWQGFREWTSFFMCLVLNPRIYGSIFTEIAALVFLLAAGTRTHMRWKSMRVIDCET